MPYRIAGIDVHKRILAVAMAEVEVYGEYDFVRRQFGTSPSQLRALAAWLVSQQVEEVVMESTAQYWRPVWGMLERYWQAPCRQREGAPATAGGLHLAQAKSNQGPRGRKNDFADAERLVKRLAANELRLSFVPEGEQRLWRTVMRTKHQWRRNQVQLQNRLEALLEEAQIKLSSLLSDLLGVSGRRILQALAAGETDPAALAALADPNLRATRQELGDALEACRDLPPLYRRLLSSALAEWQQIETRIQQLDEEMATLLRAHQDQVQRLAEIPGLGVDSAHQILAEVGSEAATFPSAGDLASWMGACPGDNESAGVNASRRSPKGNRHLRRILNQCANAAVKMQGSIFALLYRRYVPRQGHKKTVAIIAHRLCRLVWIILHRGRRYEERGPAVSKQSAQRRAARMIRELRSLGYHVELPLNPAAKPA